MGEAEVIELLREFFKKVKKEFPEGIICLSSKEIADKLSNVCNEKNVHTAITKLQKHKEIESIQVDVDLARKIYGKNLKRGLKLWFVIED